MQEAGGSRMIGTVATGILVLALLYVAQSIFAPLVFSLFVIALVWPCQAALQRWLPKLLALLITLSITMVAIVAIGSSVAWGFSKLAQWLFVNADRFQTVYVDWTDWLEGHGLAVAGPLADRFDVTWLVRFVQGMAGRVNSFAGFTLLVFIFVMLGLLEVEDFNARLITPAAQPYGMRILTANRVIGSKLRRFMIVRTFASVLTGLVVWLFALGAGLELAAAWGAIAFALNYIPFLGPLVATALPTLFAIAQFDSWQTAVVIFVSLNVIQFIIGSYLEPRLAGASLAISPFAVIFAVFFWSFMWGISGAFIGVPILIAFVVYCAGTPSGNWVATLLSGSSITNADRGP
ncbi:AI-2E family transporter [Rhizobium mesoamericanum]|uniref:AI-2E family transporter n=1 Tax=Rhizobium mesoamericanum TaxID=1079800 RepID=UPI00049036A3